MRPTPGRSRSASSTVRTGPSVSSRVELGILLGGRRQQAAGAEDHVPDVRPAPAPRPPRRRRRRRSGRRGRSSPRRPAAGAERVRTTGGRPARGQLLDDVGPDEAAADDEDPGPGTICARSPGTACRAGARRAASSGRAGSAAARAAGCRGRSRAGSGGRPARSRSRRRRGALRSPRG